MRLGMLIPSLLFIPIFNVVNCRGRKQAEELEVEIWSDETDIKSLSVYDPFWKQYYSILYSADCSRPLAPDMDWAYHAYVASVGVNLTTGTFERCESSNPGALQPRLDRKHNMHFNRLKDMIFVNEGQDVRQLGQYNKTWNCTYLKSLWQEVVGTDLPSWCTLFFVTTIQEENNGTKQYHDAQMRLAHGEDLLIFKSFLEIENDTTDRSGIESKLIESNIINKKIPKLFLEPPPRLPTTTITRTTQTTTKQDTTKTTEIVPVTKTKNDQTSATPVPSSKTIKSDDADKKEASDRHGIETEVQPALALSQSSDAVPADSSLKSLKGLIIGLFVLVAVFSVIIIGVTVTLIVILVRTRRNEYADTTSTNQTKGESTTECTSTIQCMHPTLTENSGIKNWPGFDY